VGKVTCWEFWQPFLRNQSRWCPDLVQIWSRFCGPDHLDQFWQPPTIVFICRKDVPHNCKCDITYAQFWIKTVLDFSWNIFITSIHGLVNFHQNTKQVFKEFPKTKDAISLKQHQQFFLECIILIIVDDINVKVISITCICFIQ
jgi:hypothetical protein